jgi:hypothetical protein
MTVSRCEIEFALALIRTAQRIVRGDIVASACVAREMFSAAHEFVIHTEDSQELIQFFENVIDDAETKETDRGSRQIH